MKRPEPDSPAARRRAQAAAEWLVRRDRGLTAAEQDEFLQWLAADPRHGEWLALHRGTVVDFTALAQWRPEHSEEPNPDLLAPPRRRLHWLAPVALAAAAALVLGFLIWRPQGAPQGQSLVAEADMARRILEDGSAVELNPGAEVAVAFDAKERRVTLVRGEALFTVAKNPARPFVVRAAGVDVRAVGTAFSVRLDAAAVEVLVTEGRVAIDRPADTPAPGPASPALVDAGQQATVPAAGNRPPLITPATPAQIARHLAWRPQWLDFSSAPLATAIAELNRRNRVQFILADAELAAMPVVAAIRSDNVEGFARFLAAAPGVRIERRSADEIVVHRKP
ncbi:MAG: FecR domain-containing protein [Opitutaceae bacterium]|nr:FecR domain-containing protein [Opitutaceae bacterium]